MNTNGKNISDNESHEDNEEIILNFKQKHKIFNNENSNKIKDSIIRKKDELFTESILGSF